MRKRSVFGAAICLVLMHVQTASAQTSRKAVAPATSQTRAARAQAAMPTGPHAQEIIALRAQLDSLAIPLLAMRSRDSLIRDSVLRAERRKEPVHDTATIASFRLIGRATAVQRMAPHLAHAWARMAPLFDGMHEDIDHTVFSLNSNFGLNPDKGIVHRITYYEDEPRDIDQEIADLAMGKLLTDRLPASVRKWLNGAALGNTFSGRATPHGVQQSLAFASLSHGSSDRNATGLKPNGCAHHVLADCRVLLALSPELINYNDAALRESFITDVVTHAPAGAIARSTTDTADATGAFEHIGRAPLDTMIEHWLRDVEEQSTRDHEKAAREGWVTLLWAGVFAVVAMKGTRWRLG